jgi:hypothetical protein
MSPLLLLPLLVLLVGFLVWEWRRKTPVPKEQALDGWAGQYDTWLKELEAVLSRFPDQASMEGHVYSDAEAHIINNINDLYADELYHVTTQLVLKGAQLRAKTRVRSSPR